VQHTYHVSARWRDHQESLGGCAQRLGDLLQRLARMSRMFAHAFEEPRLAKDAFKREIAVNPVALERLLLLGRSWDGEGAAIDRMGSHTAFWTAAYPGGEFCRFSVTCGAHGDLDDVRSLANGLNLEFRADGALTEQLFAVESLTELLTYVVAAWAPAWATVNTFPYWRYTHLGREALLAGWLTYVAIPSAELPPLEMNARALGPAGSLVICSATRPRPQDEAQIQALDRLSIVLGTALATRASRGS
jgi:hypothetical protein